jgi:hypothetical protein
MATPNPIPNVKSTAPIAPQPTVKPTAAPSPTPPGAKILVDAAEKPTAEAHHEAAAEHAKAEQAHKAAALALEAGKPLEAKAHAEKAATHSDEAGELTNEVVVLYELWIV